MHDRSCGGPAAAAEVRGGGGCPVAAEGGDGDGGSPAAAEGGGGDYMRGIMGDAEVRSRRLEKRKRRKREEPHTLSFCLWIVIIQTSFEPDALNQWSISGKWWRVVGKTYPRI